MTKNQTKANPVDFSLQPVPEKPVRETGIGLRGQHYKDILDEKPDIGWIEVHTENFFGGGSHRHYLSKARELYPLSFHCIGMSLGSDQPPDENHLRQVKELINIYEPFLVSDHLSWSASGNAHMNDLLPLPYTKDVLTRFCENVDHAQNTFGRKILIENPTSYIAFAANEMKEYEFLNEVAKRTGCGILLDINNIYVQAYNHGTETTCYINSFSRDIVEEIHLAGPTRRDLEGGSLLIDTHNCPVMPEVWALYEYAINHLGNVTTLIEWDSDLPALEKLVAEADKAQAVIDKSKEDFVHAAE